MERSEHIDQLAGALARAQGKFKTVKRGGANPKFRSTYSTLDDVIAAVRKPLSSEAIAYTQLVGQDELGYSLTTMLVHESGQFISETMRVVPENLVSGAGKKVRNDLQELGNALTYCKRYMLASILGVNSEVDDDGNASGQQRRNGKQQVPPPQSAEAKAAQEEKRRVTTALGSIRVAWIAKAKEVGFLSETPTSDEWGKLIQEMGPTYELYKSAEKSSKEPEIGFDKLCETGLAIITNRAPQPEPETAEQDGLEQEHVRESTPHPQETA